eukprot:TRINITY_DN1673_c0_g1_i5.p1 TRINITY_DN1673_c0_g1~~TRINITY_DN1673_c0_g1_i5.p1  ORF type:complete len:412 (+),score=114.60 TRINITY_DN1673_c0_g1_i5:60-1295(+)
MIKQPVGQVRLTNVAIIKYKIHNKKFEIACYKNKAINWRNGVETELEEVLQTNAIYSNVSKGELASTEELKVYFPGVDRNTIIKTILEKGELQISEKEREVHISAMFKDIANILAEMCIHPRTKRAISVDAIKAAMKDIHFAVVLDQDVKRQALACLKQLQKKYLIGRAEMQIQITVPSDSAGIMEEEFKAKGITTEARKDGRSTIYTALIEPSLYREFVQFLKKDIPEGALDILIQKVVSSERTDLETVAMASLQVRDDYKEEKNAEKRAPANEDSDEDRKDEESKAATTKKKKKGKGKSKQQEPEKPIDWEEARRSVLAKKTENILGDLGVQQVEAPKPIASVKNGNGDEAKGTKCATCQDAVFPSKEEYRLHFKRKQQGEPSLTYEAFTNIILEQELLQSITDKKKGK